MSAEQKVLIQKLAMTAKQHGVVIATAESCTGGMIAGALTDVAGSSAWFDCGFVTYSNQAKKNLLGVTDETLSGPGAVSAATVAQMSQGALARSDANLTVAVSGVAGPGGATENKPVGTVWIAWASNDYGHYTRHFLFDGNRADVRQKTVTEAIRGLIKCIVSDAPDNRVRH